MSISELFSIAVMQGFNGLSTFCVLLLMALGLAIIFGQMGVINMAHGEFLTVGAYTTYVLSEVSQRWARRRSAAVACWESSAVHSTASTSSSVE